jgi:hypothetical protein
MNKLRYILLGAVLMVIVIALSGFTGLGNVAQEMKPLLAKIVNTPDEPVPVAGQVNVTNPVTVEDNLVNEQRAVNTLGVGIPPGEYSQADLSTPIDVSTIAVYPGNDDVEIHFEFIEENHVISLSLPLILHGAGESTIINLTQKMRFNSIRIICNNTTKNCNEEEIYLYGN